jgi:putative ABC transport system permease protein
VRLEEIVEELSQHLGERYQEFRAEGASETDARQLAMDELLDHDALASRMRPLRQAHVPLPVVAGVPRRRPLADLSHDIRYALRMLTTQRLFAATAILTLALGIGANSAIFALVDATLLRPLPFPDPDRLVSVWQRTPELARGPVAPGDIQDWNARSHSLDGIAGYVSNVGGMVWSDGGPLPETIASQWVSAEIFTVLGIAPLAGRTFQTADGRERANVVVLSEGFWRSRFNADPAVVGTSLRLDGSLFTVVGVMPKAATIVGRSNVWAVAWNRFPVDRQGSRSAYVHAIGRLKPGVSIDAAMRDLAGISHQLAQELPTTNAGRSPIIEPLPESVIGHDLRQTALLFLVAVAVVLLICCANVANLLLARVIGRRRELAMRAALGADRFRVVRQLLTESLLLGIAGGTAGTIAGVWILRTAVPLIPPEVLPSALTVSFDSRVLLFCVLATLCVGVLFGLVPAWQAASLSPAREIASDDRATTGRGGRLRTGLAGAQVATAVVLLFSAGLLLRSLWNIGAVDRGYQAEDVLTMLVDPPFGGQNALLRFYEAVAQETMARPGVRSVGWATTLPLGRSYRGRKFFDVLGDPLPDESQRPNADYQIVSSSYFPTLDLATVEGRSFQPRDSAQNQPVCLVNEAIVQRYFGGRSPLGRRLSIRTGMEPDAPSIVREIVGVVRQVKGRPDETEDLLQLYVPLAQEVAGDIFMFVRPASGSAAALAPTVRAAIAEVDRARAVSVRSVMTLKDVARDATARYRVRAVLVTAFAALALLLAMVGLFGVLACSMAQRVREFGVRRALGATTADVLRLVLGSTARVLVSGVLVGLAFALPVGRVVATMLFGVTPLDAVTFGVVLVALAVSGAAATIAPAWRAVRVDPAAALRS